MRVDAGVILSVLMAASAVAQETEAPWRAVIDQQIEALREGDAGRALEMAGAAFKRSYSDPDRFMADIERSGYGPIITSRSHSIGQTREIGDTAVIVVVNIVGPDQRLYEAVYQLADEPNEGWRVQGVVLRPIEGIGI
jgi:hypothetical protein